MQPKDKTAYLLTKIADIETIVGTKLNEGQKVDMLLELNKIFLAGQIEAMRAQSKEIKRGRS